MRLRAGAVLLLLVLTGCGDGRLSKPDFVAKATEVCTRADSERAALPQPAAADPKQLADYLGATIDSAARQVAALRGLKPPKSDQATLDGIYRQVDQQIAVGRDAVGKLRAGDVPGATAAVRGASRSTVDKAFDDYGLRVCGTGSRP